MVGQVSGNSARRSLLGGRQSLAALAFGCVIVAAWSAAWNFKDASDSLAYISGLTLCPAMIVSVVLYHAFTKKNGDKVGILYFIILYSVAILSAYIPVTYQKRQIAIAADELGATYEAALSGRHVSTEVKTSGEVGELERLVKQLMAENASLQKSYESELEGLGLFVLFSPEELKTDPQLERASFKVARAKEIAEKYKGKGSQLLESLPQRAEALNASDYSKSQMLEGLSNVMPKTRSTFNRMWELEGAALDEYASAIRDMKAGSGWRIENERIAFFSEGDLSVFNSHLERLQQFAAEQEALLKQSGNDSRAKLEQMREAAR